MTDRDRIGTFAATHLAECAAALEFDAPVAPRGKGYRRKTETFVYFIAWDGGPIKIGFTNNLVSRLQCLQTACPYPLNILCAVPGDERVEAALHLKFAEHRLLNEWFSRCPDIEAEIERLSA